MSYNLLTYKKVYNINTCFININKITYELWKKALLTPGVSLG